ncbi:MAG: hypothetical protein SWQ30_22015 [Thermodesulfobacteriota bacterium]|nr:hypothetical protein [Thermodesulfobacteriota bacterium]
MRRNLVLLLTLSVLFACSGWANAALVTVGTANYDNDGDGTGEVYNLIYEDDSVYGGLVWLDYSNDPDIWDNQMSWASALGGVLTVSLDTLYTTSIEWDSGWRLPSAGDDPQLGGYETTHEMGHLYHESLGNPGGDVPLDDTTPFEDLNTDQLDYYWMAEEVSDEPNDAWFFGFGDGGQLVFCNKYESYDALAVHPGQVSGPGIPPTVPIQGTLWLLGSGLIGLVGIRRRLHK